MQVHVPNFSRRRFLQALGQGALLATMPRALIAEQADVVTISILHTTDLHGHILPTTDYDGHADLGGLARCVTQIRQWQRENPNWALIDVGDVYQGTEPSLLNRGSLMIQLLNALHYDAWVVGNHEFDWGIDPFAEALKLSTMPVLSGNSRIEGGLGSVADKLKPYIIKEVAGFRLAFIGLTTPGLANWLPPENLRGFEVLDPQESLRRLMREVSSLMPDAIILAGHMGLKRQDDFANRVGALTLEFPQLTVCLGGHTHQDQPGEMINGVLYTQADHFGIHAGKVELTFDRGTRQLLQRAAVTVPMTHQIPFDPLVLSMSRSALDNAAQALAQPMGALTETLSIESSPGAPSEVERLIGSAMRAALRQKGVEVDLIVHGLFDTGHPFVAGPKTVADAWTVLPYENQIVTVELTRADLLAFVRDLGAGKDRRSVMGVKAILDSNRKNPAIVDLRAADGSPLQEKPRYRVALNSYDSQSGGERLLEVARLVAAPSNQRVLHPIEIRNALIEFFVTRQTVGKSSLLV